MIIKIREIRPKDEGKLVGRIYGKGRFWVWSGTEMEWCTVKVVMMSDDDDDDDELVRERW